MMKMVVSATCSLECPKKLTFPQSHIFARHDSIRFVYIAFFSYVSFSRQTQTHCRALTFRAVGFSRMQRFLMLSVFVSISGSLAVELSDALAESERWERIRHVVVEAIPRINAGGLVAKRALLECIATASESDAVQVSFLLQSLRVYVPLFNFLF